MNRLTATAAVLALCVVGEAHASTSFSFEVTAVPDRALVKLTCAQASTGECVFWVGDAKAAEHRSIHIAAGSTFELTGPDASHEFCADPVEAHLAWPACVTSPTGGDLGKSRKFDYVFW
jgi:hypothetical protein